MYGCKFEACQQLARAATPAPHVTFVRPRRKREQSEATYCSHTAELRDAPLLDQTGFYINCD
jgi:hypothetical protein